ncbi:MAG TPA: hypothetical protein VMF52_19830 [Steroidobacteraceae bacterium]|nr:hypothetical protein [Steroidobacteraceae bacterium]
MRTPGTVPIFCPWKMGTVPILRAATCLLLLVLTTTLRAAEPPADRFSDDFESRIAGAAPGTPWKEESYNTGVTIRVDAERAFSGTQSLHIHDPRGAKYRRGYLAIHLKSPLPALQSGFYGRAMLWLDAAPEALPGDPPVHWTLLQGEGRSADDRYNSIYRLGVEDRGGLGLMANFETTPPVTTDCKQKSPLNLPVQRWACVEWHVAVATNELQFWIDGKRVAHVRGRGDARATCKGQDLAGQWLAPPKFDSFYIGFERYADSANDQDLWLDDVSLATKRVGCPKPAR